MMQTVVHPNQGDALRRVWLFGGLRIEDDGRPLDIPRGQAESLFTFLVLHARTSHPREYLAGLIWPEESAEHAGRNFSNLLYRLRKALGPHWLTVDGDHIKLRVEAGLWVDVWEFERLVEAEEPDVLEQAVALYAGDLLPEIYDDWTLMPRLALQEKHLTCLLRLGQTAEQRGEHQTALEYYRRLTEADPLREAGHLGVMRSLAGIGRLPEALSTYTRLKRLLEHELDVQPSAEARILAERLRSELATAPEPNMFVRPPFVGRIAERRRLLARLDRAQAGNGGIITVLGEAGSGKTRLLEEITQAAKWRGWQVAWGQAQELETPAFYTPLREALAAALPAPRWQQLSRWVESMWLTTVARLTLLRADAEDQLTMAQFMPALHQLSMAIRRLLEGLQQIAPHLLILDDVQWADPAIWSLLDGLREPLAEMNVLLVLSGRTEELRSQAAWATLKAWSRAGEPVVHLGGLSTDELAELVDVCGLGDQTQEKIPRLRTASGGNPLLALTLLQTGGLDEQTSAQPTLNELALRRLAVVSAGARRALEAAAVLGYRSGYRFDYGLWEAVLALDGMEVGALAALANELEQAGLIELEPDGYHFTHDTLRASIYLHMSETIRRQWHAYALTALRQQGPDDPLLLLRHAEHAGATTDTARYAQQAGEQALAAFSYRSARQYFEQALALLPAGDVDARYGVALGLTRVLDVLAEREAQREIVTRLRDLADALGDDARRAEAAWHYANLEWITGEFAQAKAIAEAGLELARRANDVRQQALLLEIIGRAARDLGDYSQATERFAQARARYVDSEDELGVAWMDGMLGLVAQRQGRLQDAIDYHTRAMQAHRESGNLFNEMRAASGLAITRWMAGDYEEARSIFERTLSLSREVDDLRMQEASLANLGGLADILGDYEAAVELKEQALALSRASDNKMGIALGLCNLGITYYKLGQLERSLAAFDEAIPIDRATGRRQGEAFSLHGRGVTLFEMGRLDEARASLEEARAIREELAERDVLLATQADLALVTLTDGDVATALANVEAALAKLREDDRTDLQEQVHYAAYRVLMAPEEGERALEHLQRAEDAMLEMAGTLPDDARKRFLRQDPLNRKVQAAIDALSRKVQVRLVRDDVPLGRSLTEADYTDVTWTVYAPRDDLIGKKTERRRHVLRRLLTEAEAQGAAPTDDDLADALGVSRRTILRDMKVLAEAGVPLPTRRRGY